jgi:streptolysin S family bacteriocin protoxin
VNESTIKQIGMGSVIKAWDEGVMTMNLGEHATITATPGSCKPMCVCACVSVSMSGVFGLMTVCWLAVDLTLQSVIIMPESLYIF